MRISKPKIIRQQQEIIYSVDVATGNGQQKLWYSLSDQFAGLLTDSSDAPLAALLIPAMAQGEDIYVDGPVSPRLMHNLSGPYQRLLRHIIPWLKPIRIYSDVTPGERPRVTGVATGFSAGIDSFCTLADYYYSQVPRHLKITHLLYHNVGSHGRGEKGDQLFQKRFSALEPVVARLGLPFIKINSNMDSFYNDRIGFHKTHTLRNVSAALLLQGGIGRYIYSSSYAFTDIFVGETYGMAFSEPVALPFLSTETFEAVSAGGEYTRVEKTLRVSDIPDSYNTLDVCVSGENAGNCSVCWKCLRTLLTLDIAGRMARYSASFDLDAYRRKKEAYITEVLRSRDPFLKEIVRFAAVCGYSFPVLPYVLGRILCCWDRMKYIIKIPLRAIRALFRRLLVILRRKDPCSCPPH
ncbi:MAG TPA: hypothetical protein PLT76_10200 [Candidatus Omnitrophota bacterium]|nr:hypothetical protein [Candidatus Omnitrophota bacterium]HQO59072.1 hypothetical protein [Candidatus Omnitrophota bacterium]